MNREKMMERMRADSLGLKSRNSSQVSPDVNIHGIMIDPETGLPDFSNGKVYTQAADGEWMLLEGKDNMDSSLPVPACVARQRMMDDLQKRSRGGIA